MILNVDFEQDPRDVGRTKRRERSNYNHFHRFLENKGQNKSWFIFREPSRRPQLPAEKPCHRLPGSDLRSSLGFGMSKKSR